MLRSWGEEVSHLCVFATFAKRFDSTHGYLIHLPVDHCSGPRMEHLGNTLLDRLTQLKNSVYDRLTHLQRSIHDRLTHQISIHDRLTQPPRSITDRLTRLQRPIYDRITKLQYAGAQTTEHSLPIWRTKEQ